MRIACIDIGNTKARLGLFVDGALEAVHRVASAELPGAAVDKVARWGVRGVAFCSVVPSANAPLKDGLAHVGLPSMELGARTCIGLAITYPKPAEIGPDRLANAIGAQYLGKLPAVVLDVGTATTFDVVSAGSGYLGGVIAPGLDVLAGYLHERTALLPRIEPAEITGFEPTSYIGKSTREAMKIGCKAGFAGMIANILDHLRAELRATEAAPPRIIVTGGATGAFGPELPAAWHHEPDITLLGLAEALRRNYRKGRTRFG